jgi:AraC-like DNA-binding protein
MAELPAVGRPLLTIGRGWAVYVGPVEPGRPHRHQAAQLAWCPEGSLTLEGAWDVLTAPGHFLPAGGPHRLVASEVVRMVFLDPAIAGVKTSQPTSAVPLTAVQAALLEGHLQRWTQGPGMSTLQDRPVPIAEDPRWVALLDWLEQALEGRVRVEDAAAAVGLSSSRFMHWFADVAGLPFRAYVRWLRLQGAVRVLAGGATLTEAAHLAGFADSAHLTRTFVATFGVRPAPLRGARIVCADQTATPPIPEGLGFL